MLHKKVQVFIEGYGDVPTSCTFCVIWEKAGKTLINCSYNVVCRKIQKPVLLRLRLAASERPVLNAPAFACIAKPKEGGENMEQTARRQEQLPGAFNGASTNSQHGRVRWYLVHTPPMEKSARPAKRSAALSRTS